MDKVPEYAIHNDAEIRGFFGIFRFLSNFFILKKGIYYDQTFYPSVENAYQAAKYPILERAEFTECSPSMAKKLGAKANIDVRYWNKRKLILMEYLINQKFLNDPNLRDMLKATGNAVLEERNNWGDIYWGTDINGEGENHLGNILMKVRRKL